LTVSPKPLEAVTVTVQAAVDPAVTVCEPGAAVAATRVPEEAPEAALPEVAPAAALPDVEPVAATPEVEPVTALPEVEPVTALPEVEPATALPEVEPVTALPEVEPVTALPEVEPATALPGVEPVPKLPESEPEVSMTPDEVPESAAPDVAVAPVAPMSPEPATRPELAIPELGRTIPALLALLEFRSPVAHAAIVALARVIERQTLAICLVTRRRATYSKFMGHTFELPHSTRPCPFDVRRRS
jgi:hypothetical protein